MAVQLSQNEVLSSTIFMSVFKNMVYIMISGSCSIFKLSLHWYLPEKRFKCVDDHVDCTELEEVRGQDLSQWDKQ